MGLQDDLNAAGDIISLEGKGDDTCPFMIGKAEINTDCLQGRCTLWDASFQDCSIVSISAALWAIAERPCNKERCSHV